jgi:hypothetical protein
VGEYREVRMDHFVVAANMLAERGHSQVVDLQVEYPRILNEVDVCLAWLSIVASLSVVVWLRNDGMTRLL